MRAGAISYINVYSSVSFFGICACVCVCFRECLPLLPLFIYLFIPSLAFFLHRSLTHIQIHKNTQTHPHTHLLIDDNIINSHQRENQTHRQLSYLLTSAHEELTGLSESHNPLWPQGDILQETTSPGCPASAIPVVMTESSNNLTAFTVRSTITPVLLQFLPVSTALGHPSATLYPKWLMILDNKLETL